MFYLLVVLDLFDGGLFFTPAVENGEVTRVLQDWKGRDVGGRFAVFRFCKPSNAWLAFFNSIIAGFPCRMGRV